MKILADENIPLVCEYFSNIGEVMTQSGRAICNHDLSHADVLLVRSVTKVNLDLLENTPVKFVASATSGTDHIQLDYLYKSGIGFAHAPGSNANSVAQYVISAICYWSLKRGMALDKLSIGIIGYGNVGKRLRLICNKLGIRTMVNDPPLENKGYKEVEFCNIEQALSCDIVSLHVPLTLKGEYATDNFINDDIMNYMKADVLFINSSRGEVVDELALLKRKRKFTQMELVMDVWQNEPLIDLNMVNATLISTPHIAGYSFDGKVSGTKAIYKECCNFFGLDSQYLINNGDEFISKKVIIDLSDTDFVRERILDAYDIVSDSAKLKHLLQDSSLQDGGYFDSLRKNYPVRREWGF